ncbi:hypothetical protein B296_00015008 [Ensete ventricosum]|uniref:Uncharacterized protein n=1 Tax=Ensete ventricosum TaxID=4639 RepID=A0A427A1R3_ENSVE|nr:hypothetical protein B296_00015008 [Ensete ventricosum]
MHPPRFPNSGIRAKVFVRKISYCYVFITKAARKEGGRPRLGPLQGYLATRKGAACYSQGQPVGAALVGKSVARKSCHLWAEAPPARAASYRQQGQRHPKPVRKGATPVEVSPAGAEPAVGAVTSEQGSCADDSDVDAEGAKGLEHSF